MEERVRIAIIHHNRLFREGLAFHLSQQQDLSVVIVAAEGGHILGETAGLSLDVIIMALALPGQDSPTVTRQLHESFPDAKILIMGLPERESVIMTCIEAGAAGYLPPEASLEDLLTTVRTVMVGEALCSPKVTGFLFTRLAAHARRWERLCDPNLKQLTRREREVVGLLEEGLSNKEIAHYLKIEVATVKNHVHNILEKLQLATRRDVARYAREQGLMRSLETGHRPQATESIRVVNW